jgi:hypothetical protein
MSVVSIAEAAHVLHFAKQDHLDDDPWHLLLLESIDHDETVSILTVLVW